MIASRTRRTSAGSLAETRSAAGNSFNSSSNSVLATLSILLRTRIPRHVAGADLFQHLACDLHLGVEDRISRIDDLQRQ